ncbi:CAP domain-containing protein [Pengzhenrongella phosphoraccumulans]|uniref:CAP domain-containing protein n=1 Tax=Pengzhenrongella phosphoraccumulans TaxID=3114394 RepID=UPI00388E6E64
MGTVLFAARLAAGLLAGLAVLSGCSVGPTTAPSTSGTGVVGTQPPSDAAAHTLGPRDPATFAGELFTRTNAVRADAGLPAVVASSCAQAAAAQRAEALVGAAELTHAPLTGVISDCAPSTTAAENLSRAAAEPADVMAAWMASPGHRSNLLDPDLTELGVGCVLDGGEMLCSQVYLGP